MQECITLTVKLKEKMTDFHHIFMLSGVENDGFDWRISDGNKHELVFLLYLCKIVGLRMTCCLEGGQSRPELQSYFGLSDLGHAVFAENSFCSKNPGWNITTFYIKKYSLQSTKINCYVIDNSPALTQ